MKRVKPRPGVNVQAGIGFAKMIMNSNPLLRVRGDRALNVYHSSKEGFSILEVVIAIFIIAMGLIGILSLVEQNLQVKYINKNGIIASMLAQEGLELVRNIRDTNWLLGIDWDNGISNGGVKTFRISYTGKSSIADVSGIDDPSAKLFVTPDGYYANVATALPTPFSRVIITSDHGDYLDAICLIRFKKGASNYDYIAQTQIYNWKK